MESPDKKKSILVITKIDTIKGLFIKLDQKYNIHYLPDASIDLLNAIKQNEREEITALFTNPNRSRVKIDKNLIQLFPNLDVVCTASTGTVHIDIQECKKNNIHILSLKKELKILQSVSSTAELAFLFMILSFRDVISSSEDVFKGNWDCEKFIGRQLNHLNVGVIGFGRLGKMFANYALAFNSKIFIYDPYFEEKKDFPKYHFTKSLIELAENVDVMSIHVHVNEETKGMVNRELMSNCKKSIHIINTSRGEIVNESDLFKFLSENSEAKYMTDVIDNEISDRDNSPIFKAYIDNILKNQILITPHIGGMTHDARYIAYHHSVNLLLKYHFKNV